jgi:hypothetical protein
MADLQSYLTAADNHNIGNQNTSWLNPEDWGTKFGNIGKFAATSVLSGANSFYNSGIAIGNLFGAGLQENDTSGWISAVDSDWGVYYRQNKEATDLAGFVLGSIIPGLGGVKLLHAGQTALTAAVTKGFIGGNLAKATGLLVPDAAKFVDLAAAQINASTTSFKLLNINTAQAIGRGLWQNTLESAAFETIVQATMFKSPVLEEQTKGDIVANIMIGGALGGAIGGAFGTAKLFGKIKESVNLEGATRLPFQSRPAFAEATSPWQKIISYADNNETNLIPRVLTDPEGNVVQNLVDPKLIANRIEANNNGIRTAIHEMSGGDTDLGNIVANMAHNSSADKYLQDFSGAINITRANSSSPAELAVQKAEVAGKPSEDFANRYVKLIGEFAGETTDTAPVLLSFGDIFTTLKQIVSKVNSYGFKPGDLWNPLELKGGANTHLEAEARYIYASRAKPIKAGTLIHSYDIPMLEKAYMDNQLNIRIANPNDLSLKPFIPSSRAELYDYIKNTKIEVANELLLRMSYKGGIPIEQGTEAAAKIANIRRSYLEGTRSPDEFTDLFANQSLTQEYRKMIKDKGLSTSGSEMEIDPRYLPKYAKITYWIDKDLAGAGANVADAITFFKSQQQFFTDSAKNVFAKIAKERAQWFPDVTDKELLKSQRTGESAGVFSGSKAGYGTPGGLWDFVGSHTRALLQDERKIVGDSLASSLTALGQNPKAAIEFSGINQKVTRSGKLWRLTPENDGLISIEKGAGIESDFIPIENSETLKFIQDHISLSGSRTDSWKEINSVRGHADVKDPSVFRPIQPDLRQYQHFAFVTDPTVTGTGHKTMIFAASEKELQALADRVPTQYKVIYKDQVEQFKLARQEYEYSRTLHENYFNSDLANRGIASDFFPKSDPAKIVDDILQQHYRESDTLIREAVRLRYEPQFNWLEDLGKQHSQTETSKFASKTEILEKTSDNPYFNYIKTALDISKISEHPLIHGFNKSLDEAVSKAVGVIQETWKGVKTPEQLGQINSALDQYGIKPAFYDASLQALANHTAPRGELTKFVRSANSVLSLFTLGLDPLNALNNAIGSNILRGTETRFITNAIKSGNTEIAGDLASLAKIALPGTGDLILSPTKLHAQAIRNFFQDDGSLLEKYNQMGFNKTRLEQLKLLVDDFTLKGTETVGELNTRLNTAFARAKDLSKTGEKFSGNPLAEQFNRFISANVMDQITSLGIKHGLIDEATAGAYINTFVNRVEGNIIASQRPLIFQGPIGQAIGLFQSYQFNLLQQLFRYVAEGTKKDLAILTGLQSTLYGAQSLPAFQFINTHIVGQLSGNKEHTDAYDAVYGTVGRTAGNFMLYGIPSNLLQANIYSRGDINPRQITVLPTSMQEIPLVSGWGKFLDSMKETIGKIAGGGNIWESILQGIEHNGVSRPLAGMAQVFQGFGPGGQVYSTSSKGSILYSNDLASWASMVRLAGGRPLDEAVVNDALFRVRTYQAAQTKDMAALSETIKTTMIKDESATPEQIQGFAEKYAALGGKQDGFNKHMMNLFRNANVPQAQQIELGLKTPFSHKLQLLMGGVDE